MNRRIDLTPTSYHTAIRRQRHAYLWIGLCLFYAMLLLVGYAVFVVIGPSYNNRQLQDRIDQLSAQRNQLNSDITEHSQQLDRLSRELAANQAVAEQPDWGILLALLAHEAGDRLMLKGVHILPIAPTPEGGAPMIGLVRQTPGPTPGVTPGQADRYHLELDGYAQNQAEVSSFLIQLENCRLFERVELVDSRRETLEGKPVIGFRIDCPFRQGRDWQ